MRVALCMVMVLLGCRPSEPSATPTGSGANTPHPAPVTRTPEPSPTPVASPVEASQPEGTEAWAEYEQAIAQAEAIWTRCRREPARIELHELVDTYEVLAPYERSPERDAAIGALERCRRLASNYIAENLSDPAAQPALDYTTELEQAVREANERTTKRLSITVKGSKVTIDERTRSTPDKRALEGYCAKVGAPDADRADRITDERGQMSCSSKFEFTKQPGYVDRRMGIATPFGLDSTEGREAPPPSE